MKKVLLSLLLVLAICFGTVAELPLYAGTDSPVSVTDLKFKSASLSLHSDLTIVFHIRRSVIENGGYENPYVVFTMNGQETIVTDYTVNDQTYAFRFCNIAPYRMNDSVTAVPYATKNGTLCRGVQQQYGIATYCKRLLGRETTTDVEKTMLVDLLNYGTATQIFADYRTDEPVNAILTEEQKLLGTPDAPSMESVLNTKYATVTSPLATWKSASLVLKQSVAIQLKFATEEELSNLSVRVTEKNGKSLDKLDSSVFTQNSDGTIQLKYQGLSSCYFGKTVLFTVYQGQTPISNTLAYSIESYASAKEQCGIPELENLVLSLMKYGNSCFRYAFGVYEQRQDVRLAYQTLPKAQQQIYAEIAAQIAEYATTVHLEDVAYADAKIAFQAVYRDYPEFFWINGGFSASYSSTYVSITPTRTISSEEDLAQMDAEYRAAVKAIVQEAKKQPTLFDTVLYVHDILVDHTEYDRTTYETGTASDPSCHTAYGCVIRHNAVCQGYAAAFQNIMQELGIPCSMVTGTANGGSHAWNLVMLEDDYYYMDLTWDDPVSDTPIKRYNYFCVTSQDLSTRTVNSGCYAPEATATAYNYFVYNGLYFAEYNRSAVCNVLRANTDRAEISLRFAGKEALQNAINDISVLFSNWGKGRYYSVDSAMHTLTLSAN